MAYVNTGIERAKTLTVDKQVGSISFTGYPKNYDITAAFTVGGDPYYFPLTNQQFQQLSTSDYNARLEAFKTYIESEEGIADLDAITDSGTPASQENTTACPIGA